MKHLPNLLTLANLVCGCIAIAFILNSQPFLATVNDIEYWVSGTEQAHWGGIFIAIAAIFDMLDGFAARALNIYSPIGADLDSLADVVSFGVAPSMILFKMLWGAYMLEPYAMDVNMLAMAPAFLIVCFAAIRLARFNVSPPMKGSWFTGMPTPAVGLFIASLPVINWYNPFGMGAMLQGKWFIYLLIAILCWLMVSKIRFFKIIPSSTAVKNAWPQYTLILLSIVLAVTLKIGAIPLIFALYILLSIAYNFAQKEQ